MGAIATHAQNHAHNHTHTYTHTYTPTKSSAHLHGAVDGGDDGLPQGRGGATGDAVPHELELPVGGHEGDGTVPLVAVVAHAFEFDGVGGVFGVGGLVLVCILVFG